MENVNQKFQDKGITLKSIKNIIKEKKVALIDSNKSKAKKTIVDKIKRFFYLQIYNDSMKFGNSDSYINVLQTEKNRLEEKNEQIDNERNYAIINQTSSKSNEQIKEEAEQKIAKNNVKIQTLEDKISSALDNIKSVEETNMTAEEIVNAASQKLSEEVNEIKSNQAESEMDEKVEEKQEPQAQSIPATPEEPKNKEVAEEEITPEQELEQRVNAAVQTNMETISSIITEMETRLRQEYDKSLENAKNEYKTFFENRENQIKKDAIEVLKSTAAERDNYKKERDQYKSHYEQVVEISNKQTDQIKEKDQTISELKQKASDNDRLTNENEMLRQQNADLQKSLNEIKQTFSSLTSKLMVGQEVTHDQTEERTKTL